MELSVSKHKKLFTLILFIKKNLVAVVKTKDDSVAKDYGITELPALIYFEKRIPSIYQEDISAEEDVLQVKRNIQSVGPF